MTSTPRWPVQWPPFWQPALKRREIWRTVLGVVLIVALEFVFLLWLAKNGALVAIPIIKVMGGAGIPPGSIDTAINLTGFFGLHGALFLVVRLLHGRRYRSLFGPATRLFGQHFLRGGAVMLGIGALFLAISAVESFVLPEAVTPRLAPGLGLREWALLLVPGLLLIFSQTLAEEAVFRGYLLQQLRARFTTPILWAVLPSLIFGALHYAPGTFGQINALGYVANASLMGVMAAFVTLRTGNLGAAAGLHFGNNASMMMVGMAGPLDGLSLMTVMVDPKSGYVLYSLILQAVVVAVAFAIWWRWMDRHRPIANTVG